MQALDVTHEQIEQALSAASAPTPAAASSISTAREYLIRNVGLTTTLEDLRQHGRALSQAAQPILLQAGRRGGVRAARQARRRRLQGQARRHHRRPEAARAPTPSTLTRADRGRPARTCSARCPPGVTATNMQFRQATFIETSIDNVQAGAARGSASSSPSCCSCS